MEVQENKKYRILYYNTTSAGCKEYRANNIKKALESTGRFEVILSEYINAIDWVTFEKDTGRAVFKNFDLVVLQRFHLSRNCETMRILKSVNIPVIYDTDDLFHDVDRKSPAWSAFNKVTDKGKENLRNVEKMIFNADAVTVSTIPLREDYSFLSKKIFVLLNYIDPNWWKGVEKKDNGEKIIIGYAGSPTHLSDIQECEGAIEQIIREYPNVYLGLGGHDFKFPDGTAFAFKNIPEDRKIVYPFVRSMNGYADMLSNFDIGLAPLKPSRFNECKSYIKYLEYTYSGAAVIASDIYPYQIIEDGVTGLTIKTKGSVHSRWYKAMKKLVEDKELRIKLNANAKKLVQDNFTLDEKNIKKYADVYEGIIKNFPKKQLPTLPENLWEWRDQGEEQRMVQEFCEKENIPLT